MLVIMTNTYVIDENGEIVHAYTKLIGAYDNMDIARKDWNKMIGEFNIPESRLFVYDDMKHHYIKLDRDGHYVPSYSPDAKYLVELMTAEVNVNEEYKNC